MFVLGIFLEIALVFFIFYRVKKRLTFALNNLSLGITARNDLLEALGARLQYVQEHNLKLAGSVDTESALYEVTKELSKSLEESEILNVFKEKISTILNLPDCGFLDNPPPENSSNEYSVFKITTASQKLRYFTIHDFGKTDRAKMMVMLNQLELFLKRSRLYSGIQELSIIDSLTGMYARRYFLERLKEECLRSKHSGFVLSLLLIDVDNFKAVNDTYGHIVGDAVLKEAAKILQGSLRQIDMCARYGGEEFCIMLPETDKEKASLVGERIRLNVEDALIRVFDQGLKCTISIGVSSYPEDGEGINPLIDKADKALYKAKAEGRNRVCLAGLK